MLEWVGVELGGCSGPYQRDRDRAGALFANTFPTNPYWADRLNVPTVLSWQRNHQLGRGPRAQRREGVVGGLWQPPGCPPSQP